MTRQATKFVGNQFRRQIPQAEIKQSFFSPIFCFCFFQNGTKQRFPKHSSVYKNIPFNPCRDLQPWEVYQYYCPFLSLLFMFHSNTIEIFNGVCYFPFHSFNHIYSAKRATVSTRQRFLTLLLTLFDWGTGFFKQFEIYALKRLEITATFLNNHRMNFQEIREKSWSGGNDSALHAVIQLHFGQEWNLNGFHNNSNYYYC